MNEQDVQVWIDAYINAWKTYDPDQIAALFSENATYAFNPFHQPDSAVTGRHAIVANWLEEQDSSGSWQASYAPDLIQANTAIIAGTTLYTDGRKYWNLWQVQFDEDGKCSSFVEWYMEEPR